MDKIQDSLDPSTKCQPRIQDPSRSRILDPGDPGSRIFLGSWHMSADAHIYRRKFTCLMIPFLQNKLMVDGNEVLALAKYFTLKQVRCSYVSLEVEPMRIRVLWPTLFCWRSSAVSCSVRPTWVVRNGSQLLANIPKSLSS